MTGAARRPDGSLHAMLDARADDLGRPLSAAIRGPLERSFGAPLGDVRIHTDPEAAATAGRMGAQAYAVGRHVVFGPGRFAPHAPLGRALLAHELAHVLQQRAPGPGAARSGTGVAEADADRSGALASAGLPAAVSTSTAPGVSCSRLGSTPYTLGDAWSTLKEEARSRVNRMVGRQEGAALEVTGALDTLIGLPYSATATADIVLDKVVQDPETKKKIRTAVADVTPHEKKMRDTVLKVARSGPTDPETKESIFIDPVTKAPALSPAVGWLGRKVTGGLGTTVFAGLPKEQALLFTDEEIGQLEGAAGLQIALSMVGVTEVEVALKVVGAIGAAKTILDSVNANPEGFATDPAFWTSVINAALFVVGLHASAAGRRIVAILVSTGQVMVSAAPAALKIKEDWVTQRGPDRDAVIQKDLKDLFHAVWPSVRNLIQAALTRRAAAAGRPPAEQPPPTPPPPAPKKAPPPPKKAPPTPPPDKAPVLPPKKLPPALPETTTEPPKAVPKAPTADVPKAVPKSPTAPVPHAHPTAPPKLAPQPLPAPTKPKPTKPKPGQPKVLKPKKTAPTKAAMKKAAPKAAAKLAAATGPAAAAAKPVKMAAPKKTAKTAAKKPAGKKAAKKSAKKAAPRKWAYVRRNLELPRRHWSRLSRIIRQLIPVCEMCQRRPSAAADHVVPLKDVDAVMGLGALSHAEARAAANHPDNLAGICTPCNSAKKDRPLGDPRLVTGGWDPPNPNERIKQKMREMGTGW